MRNFDLAPLYRATVGFDQVADLMDRVLAGEPTQNNYPPYNIEKTDESGWRISIAVAGFGADDLAVEVRENTLIVTARKAEDDAEGRTFLHRGIATRAFERRSTSPITCGSRGPAISTACCISTSCAKCPRRSSRAASRSRARSRRTPISSRKRRSTDTTGTPAGRAWRDQPVRRRSWHAKARVRKGPRLSLVAFRKNERVGPLTTRAAPRTAPSPVSPVPQNRSV